MMLLTSLKFDGRAEKAFAKWLPGMFLKPKQSLAEMYICNKRSFLLVACQLLRQDFASWSQSASQSVSQSVSYVINGSVMPGQDVRHSRCLLTSLTLCSDLVISSDMQRGMLGLLLNGEFDKERCGRKIS
jgi:hypothetical protein